MALSDFPTHDNDDDAASDLSSVLSDLGSRSPSPPLHLQLSADPFTTPAQLPTPPGSQPSSHLSSAGSCTPRSDLDNSMHGSLDSDVCPPPKRRRLNKDAPQLPRGERVLHMHRIGDRRAQGKLSDDEEFAYKSLFRCLRNKRKIVIIAGAGISVSAGIPDFRSSTGLFRTLKHTHNLKGSGKQLFDASVYRDAESTSNFHTMVRSMSDLSKSAEPTAFHHLIASLAKQDRLLRLYSQNVDGLETSIEPLKTQVPLPRKAPWPRTIQLHGGLEKMVCTKCSQVSDFKPDLFDSSVPPPCEQCEKQDEIRTVFAGKRSHGVGRLRPRMVLYNEHNPDDEAIGACAKADLRARPDAVIVVGTSCKVPGVRRIVGEMCRLVRDKRDGLAIWINHDPVPSGKDLEGCWDIIVKGNADEIAQQAGLGRWDEEPVSVESVSSVDMEAAREQKVQVMLPSPAKSIKHFDAFEDEPVRVDGEQSSTKDASQPNSKTAAVKKPLITMAAYTNASATGPAKKPPPKKARASKAKGKGAAPKNTSKPAAAIKAFSSVSKPSATSATSTKPKTIVLRLEQNDANKPMEGLPDGDLRRNSKPPGRVETAQAMPKAVV